MTVREQIIKALDKPVEQAGLYEKLCSCLSVKDEMMDRFFDGVDIEKTLDNWFSGVIQSLFYKPNHYCLVLEMKSNRIEMDFFRLLSPFPLNYNKIYESMFCDFPFEKKDLCIVEEDNFIVLADNANKLLQPCCDKRLCSYCSTTEKWIYNPRKNFIVLNVESIDWKKFNSIDKLQLWIEIFNKFKP